MEEIENVKIDKGDGKFGLIQQLPDGRIIQIGITPLQNAMLNGFIVQLSKDKPVMRMPKEFDLILKSDVRVYKKQK